MFNNFLSAQESKFRLISQANTSDSLTVQIGELMVFNNTASTICLRVSTSFRAKILSLDTIRLANGNLENGCFSYDLWISENDIKQGFNDAPRYPLILYPRTCFVSTISLIRNLKCKNSWIDFSYINQRGIDYNELLKKYEKGQAWDDDPKLKYRRGRVYFDSKINLRVKYD